MTTDTTEARHGERPIHAAAGDGDGDGDTRRDDDRRCGRRPVTDGGEDDETESANDEEERAEGEEEGDGDEESEAESEGGDGGEEAGETDEAEGEEGEEGGDGDDGEEEEGEGEHGGDAEVVYESEEASGVLHLDLDGLFLDLLGLEVNLNEVTLDVSARPGGNNLLGNLLSQVTGLLDGVGSPLGGLTDRLGGAVNRLLGVLPGVGTSGEDGEGNGAGVISRIVGWVRKKLSGLVGWAREKLSGLVSRLPLEEVLATVVRTAIRQLIEAAESRVGEEGEGEGPSEAEAEAGA